VRPADGELSRREDPARVRRTGSLLSRAATDRTAQQAAAGRRSASLTRAGLWRAISGDELRRHLGVRAVVVGRRNAVVAVGYVLAVLVLEDQHRAELL